MKKLQSKYHLRTINKFPVVLRNTFYVILITIFSSCQKELKLKFDEGAIKQVLLANFSPNNYLYLSISKSKHPDDFNPVEFLSNCKVDLYENDVFKETLPYILKDTLSGLGFYTSSFKLQQNKTYKIISTNAKLGVASAEEYLPPFPSNVKVTLLQHADTSYPSTTGKYSLSFQDSAGAKNYYTVSAYYRVLRPVVDSLGDTTYKTDYIFNIPSYTPEVPNTINFGRSYFTDANFDGQLKSFMFDFPSRYNNFYKEIYFIVEFTNVGPSYYNWYFQQLPKSDDNFNDGQSERINVSSNIYNGFGHFTAYSAVYKTIRVK